MDSFREKVKFGILFCFLVFNLIGQIVQIHPAFHFLIQLIAQLLTFICKFLKFCVVTAGAVDFIVQIRY